MPLELTLAAGETCLAEATHVDKSSALVMVVTNEALYIPQQKLSLKEPWAIRRIPLSEVRSVELRRRTAAALSVAIPLIVIGVVAFILTAMKLGDSSTIAIGMTLLPIAAGVWLARTARIRRKLRVTANGISYRWTPPLFMYRQRLREINKALDAVIGACRSVGIPVGRVDTLDEQPRPEPDYAAVMTRLRNKMLHVSPEELGISVGPGEPFMAIMDVPYPETMLTIVATAAGDASLYLTRGESRVGGSGIDGVRNAALEFVQEARTHLAHLRPTNEYPQPPLGTVRVYVRTPGQTFTGDGPHGNQGFGESDLQSLFSAGQAVAGIWFLSQESDGAIASP